MATEKSDAALPLLKPIGAHNPAAHLNIKESIQVDRMLSKSFGLLFLGACMTFGAALCRAQEALPVSPSTNSVEALPWAQREALAREILASPLASGPAESTSLALVSYREAGAWAPFDAARATSLYRQSFLWARGANIKVQEPLETAILNELLFLSPSDVAELLPSAGTETRNRLFANLIIYWLYQGDNPKAIEAFDSAFAKGIFPKDGVTLALLTTLSARSSLENRTHVFSESIRYCRAHSDHYKALAFWTDRLYGQMPATLVNDAIHTVLVEAEMDDWQRPLGTASFGGGSRSLRFDAHYDFELFVVGPALQKVNPRKARELIGQHPAVADALKKYPNGWRSFAPSDFFFNFNLAPNHSWRTLNDPLNLVPQDLGPPLAEVSGGFDPYQPNGPEASVLAELKACSPDLPQRLAKLAPMVPVLRKVPFTCEGPSTGMWCSYEDTYPRAYLFQFIATGCIGEGNPAGARAALRDLDQILDQIPEDMRINYIALEADLYLHLGDQQAATEVVDEGFRLAAKDYNRDANSATLKEVPASLWDTAEIYRRMVTLGVYASLDRTREIVNEIPDASLRAIEEIMIARALLGVPMRHRIIVPGTGQVQADDGYTYASGFGE